MSLELPSNLKQIVSSVGVMLSKILVGLQIRQNSGALERNKHISALPGLLFPVN
jgi:hypothetical protein